MSIRNRLLAIIAVSALMAVTAAPAMALENEFHGAFGVRAMTSNYLAGGQTGVLWNFGTKFLDSTQTNNFIEQRARLFYTAKANDNLKLVTAFELDSTWGKSSYVVGRANDGGALGADSVQIETKWTYLDFNIPSSLVNVKVGLQGVNDAYKGVFIGGGADAAGILVSAPVGPVTASAGFFRLDDRLSTGKQTRDLVMADAKFAVGKAIKVGASYYFLNDDNAASSAAQNIYGVALASGAQGDYNVHVAGVNAAATFGPATVDAFALYEFGSVDKFGTPVGAHVNSFAANVTGKVKLGPGTAKVNALYVNGGTNAFVNVTNTTSAAYSENAVGGAFGNMFLLVRNSGNTTNDAYIAYESSNRGLGIMGGSVGYDATITPKLFANANVGFLAIAKDIGLESKYQGTEANLEVGYKMYDNLTASVQGAYVMLGDFFKGTGNGGTDPADPYVARVVLNYVF